MKYCSGNISLLNPWISDGVHQCFIETVSLSVCFGFILLFGVSKLIIYGRKQINHPHRKAKSIFYCIQISLLLFMPVLAILRFIFQAELFYSKTIHGYMVLSLLLIVLEYIFVCYIVHYERTHTMSCSHGTALRGFWLLAFVSENLPLVSLRSEQWWWHLATISDKVEFSLWVLRYSAAFFNLLLGLYGPGLRVPSNAFARFSLNFEEDIEGSLSTESSRWTKFKEKVVLIADASWPKESYLLQFYVLVCVVILVIGRVLNLYIPLTYKYVVDSLTPSFNKTRSQYSGYSNSLFIEQFLSFKEKLFDESNGLKLRWDLILVFGLLRILQGTGIGSAGVLNGIRAQLWIRVQQYSSRRIGLQLFAHLHRLSLSWHLSKKTGEVLRIMDRGTDSLQNFLNYMLFNIVPTLVDVLIGIVYFLAAFNVYFALIVFGTMVIYLGSTVVITEWRNKYRRNMNQLDNAKSAKAVDSLLNFETVKYYGAEEYEVKRYRDAIIEYQKADWLTQTSLNFLNFIQNLSINIGFFGGAYLCAYYVVKGIEFTVGDFVLYCTYIIQLNTPLNLFGTYYRMLQQNFIDMENMFELLDIAQEVKDDPDAQSLFVRYGGIEFRNVCFSYKKEKPILKDISFTVPPGKTFALVGNSGGGKSTIIRLLFRFYDTDSGEILIDGQDIRHVTQSSLRQSIGVVPQDTVLFNQSIRENIRYGRVDATDEEIEESAKAADIHDRILTFPDKYDTVVGERGLKLSGGEKQRVAIARTLLKSPKIVLLDEATSALDTHTERNIQASINKMSLNRTCLVVAHRLSTIIDADQIIVISEGEIKERGRHDELLNIPNGLYAALWNQQLASNKNNGEEKLVDI